MRIAASVSFDTRSILLPQFPVRAARPMKTLGSVARLICIARFFLLPTFLAATVNCFAAQPKSASHGLIPKWSRFERAFSSTRSYSNPLQEIELKVFFTSPSGRSQAIDAFWDGDRTWKVRFAPNELGKWVYSTSCSDTSNKGLHDQAGAFLCTAASRKNRFEHHGPVRVARDGRSLEHEDGTPFFWLADTAWNGPLLASPKEWDVYLAERKRQKFSAIQWVSTQWRASPKGDAFGDPAYYGDEEISVNPRFFQRLDAKADAAHRAGFLNVPVLLWAIGGGSNPRVNPGVSLTEEDSIKLARYMIARWGAYHMVWFLAGDGDYRGPKADRWKRIGNAVFEDQPGIATMHPGGMHWILNEFKAEPWFSLAGYQSGHGDDERTLRWMTAGPPSIDWQSVHKPFINLEPPYENHVAYQSKSRISPFVVRRAIYWSLLCAPTAGVTYGGHGVWGWDNGTVPPTDHPTSGIPLPWNSALRMPAAEQMAHLANFFGAIHFWRLRPAPTILAAQPGIAAAHRYIAAAKSSRGDVIVVYTPEDREIELHRNQLPSAFAGSWFNPRSGQISPVEAIVTDQLVQLKTPAEGDWLLLIVPQ